MRNISSKNVILGKIKQFYGFKTNKELASFLGVANNTITNWVRRNTIDYDLIFSKCKDIDINWLLSNDNQEINQKINILDVDIKGQSASESLGTLENEIDAIRNMYNSLVRHFGYDSEIAKGDIVLSQIGYIMYICKILQPIENFRTLYRVYSQIQDRELLYKGFHRQMEKNLITIETLQSCQEDINKIYQFFKELARKMNLAPMDRI